MKDIYDQDFQVDMKISKRYKTKMNELRVLIPEYADVVSRWEKNKEVPAALNVFWNKVGDRVLKESMDIECAAAGFIKDGDKWQSE